MKFIKYIIIVLFFSVISLFSQNEEAAESDINSTFKVARKDTIKIGARKIFFYSKSKTVELSKQMKEYYNILAEFMIDNPGIIVKITGHADNAGTLKENDILAEQRADKVFVYLKSKGVITKNIMTIGMGAKCPIADNKKETGRKKNRRVEIELKINERRIDLEVQ